ncbi:fasciclin-like arabinogalactan protein 11 [Forsythia ovata]|uniref:Fasciclin-like arabinogalactan protein 11 n=1 Tax=Forsythia ovata TaxID=205694 RepID=A0ABD1RK72_9LAMI
MDHFPFSMLLLVLLFYCYQNHSSNTSSGPGTSRSNQHNQNPREGWPVQHGLTVFAPADNAFSSLKSGTLNSLSDQQKVALVQFHVLPTFLSVSQFQTVSNPLRTQAGNNDNGQFPLNVTTSGNQVNVSTGVDDATVANTIYTDNQLAVYQVDKVLLPLSIFASPAPVPAPAAMAKSKKKSPAADAPVSGSDDDPADASGTIGLAMHGMLMVVPLGVGVIVTRWL